MVKVICPIIHLPADWVSYPKIGGGCKNADTTRPVTAALAGVVMSNTTSYPENLDLVGYNYQEYRYADDHKTYPQRIIYGSENGKSPEHGLL